MGLVTNPTGVIPSTMEHAVDVMHSSDGAVDIRAVFGPEHGFRGNAQAGVSTVAPPSTSTSAMSSSPKPKSTAAVSGAAWAAPPPPPPGSFLDPRTGIPVYDTYLKSGPELTALLLKSGVDTIAFDIQDVGARFYTYVWTLYDVMVASAAAEPPLAVVVFDRPNPLGGDIVEGPVDVDASCTSFVARKPIAVRHGMTVGELAWMFNKRFVPEDSNNPRGKPVELVVVPMRGWRRRMTWQQTGLPWVPPSPNMPTPATALAYVGTCLFEGTKDCSEGRGTALPFELVGAPWADGKLIDAMRSKRWSSTGYTTGTQFGDGGGGGGGGEKRKENDEYDSGGRSTRHGGMKGSGDNGAADEHDKGGGGGAGGGGFMIGGSREFIALRGRANRDGGVGGRDGGRGGGGVRVRDIDSVASTGSRASSAAPTSGPAASYREAYFTPTSGALQGKLVAGVQVFPLGVNHALFREGVELLATMKRLYPASFGWRGEEQQRSQQEQQPKQPKQPKKEVEQPQEAQEGRQQMNGSVVPAAGEVTDTAIAPGTAVRVVAAAARFSAARRRAQSAVFMSPVNMKTGIREREDSEGEDEAKVVMGTGRVVATGTAESMVTGTQTAESMGKQESGVTTEVGNHHLRSPRKSRKSGGSSGRNSLDKPPLTPKKKSTNPPPTTAVDRAGRPPFIDLLTGSARLREALNTAGDIAGDGDAAGYGDGDAAVGDGRRRSGDGTGRNVVDELFASWEEERRAFVNLRRGFLLYD